MGWNDADFLIVPPNGFVRFLLDVNSSKFTLSRMILIVSSFENLVGMYRSSLNSGAMTFLAKFINSASLGLDLQCSSIIFFEKLTDC